MFLFHAAKVQKAFDIYALHPTIVMKNSTKIIIFKQCGINLFYYLCMIKNP